MSTLTVIARPAGEARPSDPPVGSRGEPLVLIAEPDDGLSSALAQEMGTAGFAVETTRDGLETLYRLDATKPDLVVLDLDMPVISGYRLLHLLRQDAQTSALPVIVLSSYSFQEAYGVARQGADAFITLPVEPLEVAYRAREVLGAPAVPQLAGR